MRKFLICLSSIKNRAAYCTVCMVFWAIAAILAGVTFIVVVTLLERFLI